MLSFTLPRGAGIGFAFGINAFPFGINPVYDIAAAVICVIFTAVVVSVAIWSPARMAASTTPLEAFQAKDREYAKGLRSGIKLDKNPIERMAWIFMMRDKKKVFLSVLSLSICGVLFLCIVSFFSSFDYGTMARQQFPRGEIKLEFAGGAEADQANRVQSLQHKDLFNESFLRELEGIENVNAVIPYKGTQTTMTLPTGDHDMFMVDCISENDFDVFTQSAHS